MASMGLAGSSKSGIKSSCVKAPARPSSSVLVVSPKLEFLLLHRVPTSSSFPSAHVFPGGNIEQQDGHVPELGMERHQDNLAYRVGALRELFEESGILLARKQLDCPDLLSVSETARKEGRKLVHSNKMDFQTWLTGRAPGAVLDTDNLIPFSRWITPPNLARRFTTQMYLYILPSLNKNLVSGEAQDDGHVDIQSSSTTLSENPEDGKDFIPTPDSGIEITTATFAPAHIWLQRARSGDIILFPPQYLLLHLASGILDGTRTGASDKSDSIVNQQRLQSLRRFISFRPADGSPPWSDKCISPHTLAMSHPREDGKVVLVLDRPGLEAEGTGLQGDGERVLLVKWIEGVPRELEVRLRKGAVDRSRAGGVTKL